MIPFSFIIWLASPPFISQGHLSQCCFLPEIHIRLINIHPPAAPPPTAPTTLQRAPGKENAPNKAAGGLGKSSTLRVGATREGSFSAQHTVLKTECVLLCWKYEGKKGCGGRSMRGTAEGSAVHRLEMFQPIATPEINHFALGGKK